MSPLDAAFLRIEDRHTSLRYHLRHTAPPRPGSDRQLHDLLSLADAPPEVIDLTATFAAVSVAP